MTRDGETVRMQDADRHTARFYTTQQLSARQSVTPEGFLVLHDVPLARTGTQIYGEHELPGLRGRSGIISVRREADEVFKDEAVRSFHGKPVTNDHPPEKVTPDNYRSYAVGTVLNPHRGDGTEFDANFLYGDLLITDRQAMNDIRAGKREVSAGYDAEYQQTGDGEGRQYNIVGNHVALVKKGRCGPLCYIGDKGMGVSVRDRRMIGRRTSFDRILDAFRSNDEGALVEELEKVPELMGEQVSGKGGNESRDQDGHHVEINLHGMGGHGAAPAGRLDASDPSSGGGSDPDNGGGGGSDPSEGGSTMQQILQRLDAIEQAIVLLAQGDDGSDPDAGNGNGEDQMGLDEEAGAPPTDEPQQRPGNTLPYGAGSEGRGRDGPQLGAGRTGDRRGTRDGGARSTADAANVRVRNFVGDSSKMKDAFADALARAVMLVPEYKLPTFDAAAPAKTTFDALCSLRRDVLDLAYHNPEKREFINVVLGGEQPNFKDANTMTCDSVAMLFNSASELVRQQNNSRVTRPRTGQDFGRQMTPAEINQRNREKYKIGA